MNPPVYLDCNATTPICPEVLDVICDAFAHVGNPSSRSHLHGHRARNIVEDVRQQIAGFFHVHHDEIVFTSGATESNNLAILGLISPGCRSRRRHVVTSMIEHPSVLSPIAELERMGFEISRVAPSQSGVIDVDTLTSQIREDTLFVSLMQVNNETGAIQPIEEIASFLVGHPAIFHVDATQAVGKLPLPPHRVDLLSLSAHKLHGPPGVGALVLKNHIKPMLRPRVFGGEQEGGWRSGTLATPLIVGLGKAIALAFEQREHRRNACLRFRAHAIHALSGVGAVFNVPDHLSVPHVLSVRFRGLDSEIAMASLRTLISISNGSACSSGGSQSHVLQAMGMYAQEIQETLRFSWSHLTPEPDWERVCEKIRMLSKTFVR